MTDRSSGVLPERCRPAGLSLRRTAGLIASLLLATAGCHGDGASSESVVIRLATDAVCYGIAIDVSGPGLDSMANVSCTADQALIDQGCRAGVSATADGLALTTRGCFTADGATLFRCTLPKALARDLRDSAQVRCGCGCAPECPSAPTVDICDPTLTDCETVASTSNARPRRETRTITESPQFQVTTVSSSTTFCGTCCDVLTEPGVKLTVRSNIRELEFDIDLPVESKRCPDIGQCSVAAGMDGPSSQIQDGPSALHVCMSSKEGFVGARRVLDCMVASGGNDQFRIRNVRALDDALKSIDPPPPLVSDPN